jgi:GMP synthase-like glutamine amidotransferase
VLGICAGHQSIGLFFGAAISGGVEIETGNCTIDIAQDNEIFKSLGRSFEIESVHWASVAVPGEFQQLARSRSGPQSIRGCENQVMVHKNKPIYGCQFHPEYSAKGTIFLNNFLNIK